VSVPNGGDAGSRGPALIAVYADESCLGNGREGDNPGGAAGLIECVRNGSGELARFDFWVSDPATTNNRMALRSVIEAFRILGAKGRRQRVVFTSDSNYIVKGMTEWIHGWKARGWTRKGGAIENLELWREAADAVKQHEVQWVWVRGHDGHAQNEYANDLAIRAARELTSSAGAVESGFDAWLAAKSAKGKVRAPTAFPPGSFRAARAIAQG
jgi:ribonuclease HI